MNSRKDRGFTLVEIMVVVVILGMLATLVLPNVLGSQATAQDRKAKADLAAIHSTVKLYFIENGSVPTLEELIEEDDKGQAFLEGYDEVPKDPWGNPYYIAVDRDNPRNYAVWSNGPDGIEDTEDDLRSDKKQQ